MSDFAIKKIYAREVLDSRGTPTVEAEVFVGSEKALAMVPSGASTGIYEALELRDGDAARFNGKGVLKAVNNVNKLIGPAILGMDVTQQEKIDEKMIQLDGTQNKSKLGANAILAVSMAVARASAQAKGKQLYELWGDNIMPVPFMNIINGGKHADNELSFQEFMIVPLKRSFKESMRMGAETYQVLKKIIKEKYGSNSTNVGDEGGFAPRLSSVRDALDLLTHAIEKAGYENEVKIAMDIAASEFYQDNKYTVDKKQLTASELLQLYLDLVKQYPIISIEDAFDQEGFDDYANLTKALAGKIQVVGDDLLVTNVERISRAIEKKSCTCLLLKVNQIGSITESLSAANMAKKAGWGVMVSHRSGETEDSFIADLAVGIGAGQIKSGAPCRSERLAKYNRLIRIEEDFGKKARYSELLSKAK